MPLSPVARPPSPFRLLARVWLVQAGRRLRSVTEQSRLLVALIAAFIVGYCVIAFFLFYHGLNFANRFTGLGTLLTERLIFLMFAFLFLLLLVSNLVIGYSNLFRNRETSFLLSLPIPTHTIYRWKFVESTLLASWAFLFLIAPLLAAFGLVRDQSWHFYLITVVFLVLFILLPGIAGSCVAVIVARYLDRRSFQVVILSVLAVALIGVPLLMQPEHFSDEQLEARVYNILDQMLSNTKFVQFPLLPSYWLSAGVLNWADGARSAAAFFALVLLSNVLFFGMLVFTRMGSPFYEAASAVNSRGSALGQWRWFRRLQERQTEFHYSAGPLDRLARLLWFLHPGTRALLVKDVRMFWRDTSQWAQTLILFGLLGLYIINLRQFTQQANNPFWVFVVSYLNLGACSLNLATLTTRFVYPQFSLEGKRIWIVGMAPLGLVRVVNIKFWLAFLSALFITLTLIATSCHMLRLPLERTVFFGVAVTVMTFTLTAMAVGFGVLYPNFKEENPSKIVSGFGGTFCLVMSFLYIVASVTLLVMGSPWRVTGDGVPLPNVVVGTGMFLLLSTLLGVVPLWMGLRRLRELEL
ncbi:MAG TPA: hypothetical protein DCY13_17670 [Verrucomicrobiales bacterium]|nr:hypothetical protein [Verrucomicrobiales bacterium]